MSVQLTVIVPVFNEIGRIERSVSHWRQSGLLDAFDWVIVDDGSSDGTPALLERLFAAQRTVTLINVEEHASKYCALARGVACVNTPLVLCLDADTWFEGPVDLLLAECETFLVEERDVVAFRIEPVISSPPRLLARLQAAEYAFLTDVTRNLFGYVGNVNGAAVLWRAAVLRRILLLHSLCFEGDDLESTVLLHQLHASVAASALAFKKHPKSTLRQLAVQRSRIWDVGLFRVVFHSPPLGLVPSVDTVFLQWYMLFEGFLHPLKIWSILMFAVWCVHPVISATPHTTTRLVVLAVYLSALFISVVQWIRCVRRTPRAAKLLPLLLLLFIYPTMQWVVTFAPAGFAVYLASWIGIAAIQAARIRGDELRRFALRYCWILPFYFLLLAVVFRTVGWFVWVFQLATRHHGQVPSVRRARALAELVRAIGEAGPQS